MANAIDQNVLKMKRNKENYCKTKNLLIVSKDEKNTFIGPHLIGCVYVFFIIIFSSLSLTLSILFVKTFKMSSQSL